MGIHNIQCWKNSAVGLAGFATGNQELIREAIDDPDRGFRAQIARGVTDDGLWFEGSLGYHRYTMDALWPLAEAARHAGIGSLHRPLPHHLRRAARAGLPQRRPARLQRQPRRATSPPAARSTKSPSRAGRRRRTAAWWRAPAAESLQALLYGAEEAPSGPHDPRGEPVAQRGGLRHAARGRRGGGGTLRHARRRARPPG